MHFCRSVVLSVLSVARVRCRQNRFPVCSGGLLHGIGQETGQNRRFNMSQIYAKIASKTLVERDDGWRTCVARRDASCAKSRVYS